jgi:hypothetical protein
VVIIFFSSRDFGIFFSIVALTVASAEETFFSREDSGGFDAAGAAFFY